MSRFSILLAFGSLLLLAPAFEGCGGSSAPVNSVVNANQRLTGSWRLQSFVPQVPLDLPLSAVLSAEINQLVVTFNQSEFTCVGPGINLTGRYVVTSAAGDQLQMILYDAQAVGYRFSAQFSDNQLHFENDDKPWAGVGALDHL